MKRRGWGPTLWAWEKGHAAGFLQPVLAAGPGARIGLYSLSACPGRSDTDRCGFVGAFCFEVEEIHPRVSRSKPQNQIVIIRKATRP
jgi:hypothetical protein